MSIILFFATDVDVVAAVAAVVVVVMMAVRMKVFVTLLFNFR